MADALGQFRRKAFGRSGVKAAYDALADEFAFLDEVLRARAESGLTQAEVAARHQRLRRIEKIEDQRRHER